MRCSSKHSSLGNIISWDASAQNMLFPDTINISRAHRQRQKQYPLFLSAFNMFEHSEWFQCSILNKCIVVYGTIFSVNVQRTDREVTAVNPLVNVTDASYYTNVRWMKPMSSIASRPLYLTQWPLSDKYMRPKNLSNCITQFVPA